MERIGRISLFLYQFLAGISEQLINSSTLHFHHTFLGGEKRMTSRNLFSGFFRLGLPNQGMARTLWASATPGDDVNVGNFLCGANWDGRDREIWFQVANQDTGWWLNQPI